MKNVPQRLIDRKQRHLPGLVVFGLVTYLLGAATLVGQESPASIWDGIYTAEQAERGAEFYASGCAECHGSTLQGDDMSPPLIGSDFRWDWDGTSVGDMFERLRISMPDGDASSMTNQEKADVMAFMYRENGYPAGESELEASTSALRPINFSAVEP